MAACWHGLIDPKTVHPPASCIHAFHASCSCSLLASGSSMTCANAVKHGLVCIDNLVCIDGGTCSCLCLTFGSPRPSVSRAWVALGSPVAAALGSASKPASRCRRHAQ